MSRAGLCSVVCGAMTVWQIAAGSLGRDYADRFLRHELAFGGGDWQCDVMDEVRPGDVVVLIAAIVILRGRQKTVLL
jgi:hypothetical protein